jgi:hypothetical protein
MIDRFRQEVYQNFLRRKDAGLDLLDGLTSREQVESPVAVSESPLFRRGFGSVYDVLGECVMNKAGIRQTLGSSHPADAQTIGGYEVYATDCTDHNHPEAETLADRTQSRKGKMSPLQTGHRYSWLVRVIERTPSWCLPQSVERVGSKTTDSQVAAEQLKDLDGQSSHLKVVVADSLYCNQYFLGILLTLRTIVALVRMRSNQVLYEEPPEKVKGQRGRPRIHGAKFKLSAPSREPERSETVTLFNQQVRLAAWTGLHLRTLPLLAGLLLRVEFLTADGVPRFKRPLFLFWTGPWSTPLADICSIYLWRFAIEHMFRFMKQHLGLTTSRSPVLAYHERWVWFCALAYTQLLLIRHQVAEQRPPWHRRSTPTLPRPLTARQVQRNALAFLLDLEPLASDTKPAGKGHGRPFGFHPKPRIRHRVVKKPQKPAKSA